VKMIIAEWYHIPTWASLIVIALVLTVAIAASIKSQGGLTAPPEPAWDDVHGDPNRVQVPPPRDDH
jgi:hypothetical protein